MVGDWPKSRLAEAVRGIAFFGLLYLYVAVVVQPCLIYSCANITTFPVFYRGWPFLRECLSYPGGLLRYVNALLPQFFYYSWAGALVITGQAWALAAGTGWLLRILEVPGRRVLRFVPALLVVVPYAQYSYHFSTINGAALALLLGCLYLSSVSRLPVGRAVAWVVLSVGVYILGAAAYLPFAALCVGYEVLYRRRYGLALVYLLVAAVVPYAIGVLLFHVSIVNAYTDLLPLSWQARDWLTHGKMIEVVYVLYLFPSAVTLVWGLGRALTPVGWVLNPRGRPAATGQTRGLRTHPTRRLRSPAVTWSLGTVVLFAGAGGVAYGMLDHEQGALLAVHYYACQRRWPEVLQAARRCAGNLTVLNAVDRALYHTGRFPQDLFAWPQQPNALLLTGDDHSMSYWHKFDTLIDLGLMNLAEKNLTECMETFGEQPMILQRLALVNLAKGKSEAARIYLERLQKTLFFRGWAEDYLGRLERDPTLAADGEVQQWRRVSLRKDSVTAFYVPELMLASLVEQGGNRMAFEYLMGWCMANRHLDRVVQNLPRLREFGYAGIPPVYQEAVLIYAANHPVPLAGFSIDPQIEQRIRRINATVKRYGKDMNAAFPELAREFAGSYFFYFLYANKPTRP